MSVVLLDTHTWVWSLGFTDTLSPTARNHIETAHQVLVSPITFFEIAQKVRIGKWPEMAPHINELPGWLTQQGGGIADLTPAICALAGIMSWDHRDPFDRLLAATALQWNMPIISADPVFDAIVTRIW